MALIIKNKVVYGGVGGGDNSVDLTMAEYKALEAAGTVMSDTTYYITDADNDQYNASSVVFDDTNTQLGAVNVQVAIEKTNDDINELNSNMNIIDEAISKLSEDIATKASAIKEKASGEVIVATDSTEGKPLGLAIDGKSEQNQYSGKNLFDYDTCLKNNYSIRFDVEPNKTLYRNGELGGSANWGLYDVNDVLLGTFKDYNFTSSNPLVLPSNASYVYAQNDLSLGSTLYIGYDSDTTYEPFVGGKPSPSPEFSQEIRNIGVYDEASGKYAVEVKCTGKNLIPFPYYDGTGDKRGVVWTINADGIINANGTATGGTSFFNIIKNNSEFAKYGKVVCSLKSNASGIYMRALSGSTTIGSTLDNGEYEIDLTSVTDFNLYLSANSGVTLDNAIVKVMIRPVGTDDTYEPNKVNTATVYLDEPLCSIDESKDILCYKNSISDVERYIGIVDMSNLNWNRSTSYANAFFYANIDDKKIGSRIGLCTDFVCDNVNVSSTSFGAYANDNSFTFVHTNIQILVRCDTYSDVGAFKTAMQGVKLYYELAEPITEEIDIDLGELTMFYPTTILSNDCNANMEVEYIADTKAYIDKKFAELATAMV